MFFFTPNEHLKLNDMKNFKHFLLLGLLLLPAIPLSA